MKLLGRYPFEHIWNAFQGFFSHSIKNEKSTLEYMQLKAEFDDDSATVSDSEHELTLYRKPKEAVSADMLSTGTTGVHYRPVYFSNGVPKQCTTYITAMLENKTLNSGDMATWDNILVVNHNMTANKNIYIRNTGTATLTLNINNRLTKAYATITVAAGATSSGIALNKNGGLAYITKTETNKIYISREYTT